jgi:Glycosyl transferase family 2
MSRRTPLALFVYNRPGHTIRALNAISRLDRLDEIDLIIYSDAPKVEAHAALVDEVRAVVRAYAESHRAEVVQRRENLGLARSIAGSVSNLTEAFDRVILLEDDLVPSPDFLSFMLDGLECYQNEPSVLQISGCLLPGSLRTQIDGFFLPLSTTWGWATWRRAWSAFQPLTADDRIALDADPELKHRFNAEGMVDYVDMLDARLSGKNDSWGILWWYAVAKARGLVLYPRESLIWNGGFDASGVHCGGTEAFRACAPEAFNRRRLTQPLRLPDVATIDTAAWASVLAFLSGGAARRDEPITPVSRAISAAKRLLKIG